MFVYTDVLFVIKLYIYYGITVYLQLYPNNKSLTDYGRFRRSV